MERFILSGGLNCGATMMLPKIQMIKIDLKTFIQDYAWFGWYHTLFGWVRGTNEEIHLKILKVKNMGEFLWCDGIDDQ
jgi:hypothetical protein